MSDPKLITLVEKLIDWVKKLEANIAECRILEPHKIPLFGGREQQRDVPNCEIVSWNCGKTGHVSIEHVVPPQKTAQEIFYPLRDGSHAGE